ncbi:hypothetical protein [Photobacterium rosenbergii]|uniref:Uncharacterized protein n=1 Tax=Photobacterium rosenbergii TaxID=294936 RepID=A0A2T3N277_9GAMM|nr:hypothetical protein [Photobacterium rosenbergii]MBY5945146.1 hypothetical protein [Photobacterium rosenbergii]PSW06393.1 hypothetical protein C9J01_26770 [Photobacterium rosenbergii]
MGKLSIGRDTISDIDAVEYQWIASLSHDGVEVESILALIQRCLGGDATTAEYLRRIALKLCQPAELLQYLES